MSFCTPTPRRKTREVRVGPIGLGSSHPIRIQSMTNSPTSDVAATLEQIFKLVDRGCEMVRLTVQGMKEARACQQIKNTLEKKGIYVPIIADIHFYPPAAMEVVEYVDKVRINPGNYVDKRATFKQLNYDEQSYSQELEKIDEKFSPLVLKCKLLGKAMRIGTNHGSLSDRILCQYGDTPEGMLQSAIEFAQVCRRHDFHNFLFSMKSSNVNVMLEAYLLLCRYMDQEGWDYPLHLGVTEAGEGEDGRLKSAVGIGGLLLRGIGDTIRVSLTEDPWDEIDPCQKLVDLASATTTGSCYKAESLSLKKSPFLHKDASVILPLSFEDLNDGDLDNRLGVDGNKLSVNSGEALLFMDGSPISLASLNKLHRYNKLGYHIFCKQSPLQKAIDFSTPVYDFSDQDQIKEGSGLAMLPSFAIWLESKDLQSSSLEKLMNERPLCIFACITPPELYELSLAFQKADNPTPLIAVFDGRNKEQET